MGRPHHEETRRPKGQKSIGVDPKGRQASSSVSSKVGGYDPHTVDSAFQLEASYASRLRYHVRMTVTSWMMATQRKTVAENDAVADITT